MTIKFYHNRNNKGPQGATLALKLNFLVETLYNTSDKEDKKDKEESTHFVHNG